jgi:CBS domain-containing protein
LIQVKRDTDANCYPLYAAQKTAEGVASMYGETDITVREIMQSNVLCVEDNWPLNRLAIFLTDHQISGAPVTSAADGRLVGVVSLTDIVRYDSFPEGRSRDTGTHEYYLHNLESQVAQEEARDYHVEHESSATVSDIMTPMIFDVQENTSIRDAADTMVKGHIHRLLVTRDKRISGIITALDILKALQYSAGTKDLRDIA